MKFFTIKKYFFLVNVLRKAPLERQNSISHFQTWTDNALKDLTALTKPGEKKLQEELPVGTYC